MIKSRQMTWAGRVARGMKNAYNILVVNHEGKRPRPKWDHSHSSLGMATGWTVGVPGFDFQLGAGNFAIATMSRSSLVSTQPPT
jgi:hypothetical protein